MFGNQNVSANEVLSTRDMNVRPGRDVTEIVGTFLTVAEAVVAHWVEYSKGLLLFVMVPGDDAVITAHIPGRRMNVPAPSATPLAPPSARSRTHPRWRRRGARYGRRATEPPASGTSGGLLLMGGAGELLGPVRPLPVMSRYLIPEI